MSPARPALRWEPPLDLFKLFLTLAALWALLGPLGSAAGPVGRSGSTVDPAAEGRSASERDGDAAGAPRTVSDDAPGEAHRDAAGSDRAAAGTAIEDARAAPPASRPPPPPPQLALSGEPGTLAAGAAIEGSAAPGARLRVYDDDRWLGEAVADAEGGWRLALPASLAGDRLALRIVSLDEAGREQAEITRSLRILPTGLPKTGRGVADTP